MSIRRFGKYCFDAELVKCGDVYQVQFIITPTTYSATFGDYQRYFKVMATLFSNGKLAITRTNYESAVDFLRSVPTAPTLPMFSQLYEYQKNEVEAAARSAVDPKERLAHQWNSLGFAMDKNPSEITVDVNNMYVGEHVLNATAGYFFNKELRFASSAAYEKENDANEVFEKLCGLLQ